MFGSQRSRAQRTKDTLAHDVDALVSSLDETLLLVRESQAEAHATLRAAWNLAPVDGLTYEPVHRSLRIEANGATGTVALAPHEHERARQLCAQYRLDKGAGIATLIKLVSNTQHAALFFERSSGRIEAIGVEGLGGVRTTR